MLPLHHELFSAVKLKDQYILYFNLLIVVYNISDIGHVICQQKAIKDLYLMGLSLELSGQSYVCKWAIEYNNR